MAIRKRWLNKGNKNHVLGAIFFIAKFLKEIDYFITEPDNSKADVLLIKKDGKTYTGQIKSSSVNTVDKIIAEAYKEVEIDKHSDDLYKKSEKIFLITNNSGVVDGHIFNIENGITYKGYPSLTFENEKTLTNWAIDEFADESYKQIAVIKRIINAFTLYIYDISSRKYQTKVPADFITEGLLLVGINSYVEQKINENGNSLGEDISFLFETNPDLRKTVVDYIFKTSAGLIKKEEMDFGTENESIEKYLKDLVFEGKDLFVAIKEGL